MNTHLLPKGTLVHITSYGPVYGRKGTIQAGDCIGEDGFSPIVFYLVALQDEPGKTLWLEEDAIEVCTGELLTGSAPRAIQGFS